MSILLDNIMKQIIYVIRNQDYQHNKGKFKDKLENSSKNPVFFNLKRKNQYIHPYIFSNIYNYKNMDFLFLALTTKDSFK